jgi:SNF2 family DNA or RNA helicase
MEMCIKYLSVDVCDRFSRQMNEHERYSQFYSTVDIATTDMGSMEKLRAAQKYYCNTKGEQEAKRIIFKHLMSATPAEMQTYSKDMSIKGAVSKEEISRQIISNLFADKENVIDLTKEKQKIQNVPTTQSLEQEFQKMSLQSSKTVEPPKIAVPKPIQPTPQQIQIANKQFFELAFLQKQMSQLNAAPILPPSGAILKKQYEARIRELSTQIALYQTYYDPNFLKNQLELAAKEQHTMVVLTKSTRQNPLPSAVVESSESHEKVIQSLYHRMQSSKGVQDSCQQPKELKLNLLPYQLEGLSWLKNNEKEGSSSGGLLCDDMGLGKTVESLVKFNSVQIQILSLVLSNKRPKDAKTKATLIVCTLSLLR